MSARPHSLLSGRVRRLTTGYDYQVKFVVDRPDDLAEIDAYLARYPHFDRGKVFLMPQARSKEELTEKTPWLEREAISRGVRVSPRLHVEWWGNTRGV